MASDDVPYKGATSSQLGSDSTDVDSNSNASRLVLRPWHKRFGEQWMALCGKQVLVYRRSARATMLRLLSPFFFMFLLWLLNLAFQADNQDLEAFQNTANPAVELVEPIPLCSDDVNARSPCYDFFFTPNTSTVAKAIIQGIRENNPGRVINESSVLGFPSIQEANTWLLANPERTTGGFHFQLNPDGAATATPDIGYVLQINGTTKFFRGQFQNPTFFAGVPLQIAVEREIARYHWTQAGKPGDLDWTVSTSQYAHPTTGSINLVGQAIGPMVFAANLFNFIILLSSIVSERERGLRQALTVAGMLDSAFWLSWLAVEMVISVFYALLLMASGFIFQFDLFLENSFAVLFMLYLLFQWAMIGFAFFLSPFIKKSSTAINLGFVIFILGWIIQSVVGFGFPYSPDYISSVPVLTLIFTLLPWAPLAKAGLDLGSASEQGRGISWGIRNDYCQNTESPSEINSLIASSPDQYWDFDCVYSINQIYITLFLEYILYVILGIYIDNVKSSEGRRRSIFYCCSPSYWCGVGSSRKKNTIQTASGNCDINPPVLRTGVEQVTVDGDVLAEEERMKELLQHRTGSADALALEANAQNAVEVFGLQKAFGRSFCKSCFTCSCCCGKKRSSEFWAIAESWFAIERGSLFCLLGPNGAGKTTTINCLTGVLAPTGGDALIYGESLSSPGGLDRVRSVMGVCPQFDMLWGELTGHEHLMLYGRIKGLPKTAVEHEAQELLASVQLSEASDQVTSAYSGGMRRRLSVAVALLGDPLIVYLDEPTTGMDPISRRHVWDIIESFKSKRAIVLTTHSMEEADILGDKIAIMARGRVRAIGPSLRLKQRFGAGYQLAVSTAAPIVGSSGSEEEPSKALITERAQLVKDYFSTELNVSSTTTGGYIQFLIPKDKETQLPAILSTLEATKEFGVSDVQIGLTTLEEVFLNIARQAELETAEAQGRSKVKVNLENGNILEVPMGEEYATDGKTGIRYKIRWAQDESGNLQVLRWTPVVEGQEEEEEDTTVLAAPGDVQVARGASGGSSNSVRVVPLE